MLITVGPWGWTSSPSLLIHSGVGLRRVCEPSGLSPEDGRRGQGRTLAKSRFTSFRPSPFSFSVRTLTS